MTANAIPNDSLYFTGMERLDNRAEAYTRIAIAQANQRNWIAGILMAGRIKNDLYQSLALSRIATIIGETGELKIAKEVAMNLPLINQRACALKGLALLEAKSGAWDSALTTAAQITSEGKCFTYGFQVVDSVSSESVIAKIALLKAKTGDPLSARNILIQVQDDIIRHNTTSQFAALQAESDDLEGAKQTLSAIPSQHRDLGLTAIALCQAKRLQFEEAHRTALEIGAVYEGHRAEQMIVALETAAGHSEQAILFALAHTDLADITRLLAEIAYRQGIAGQVSEALDTLKKIPSVPYWRSVTHSALFSIAAFTAENQSSLRTPAWIDELLSLKEKPYAYMGLAKGFLQKQIAHRVYSPLDLSTIN